MAAPDETSDSVASRLRSLRMPQSEAPPFDPAEAPGEPFALFLTWLDAAIAGRVVAPHAMVLATAGHDGADARTLLLTDVGAPGAEPGWISFASTADSPKGRQLAADPRAAVVLHWREQHRQVRMRGAVEPAPRETSVADFTGRPPAFRAGTLAGSQSSPRPDDDEATLMLAEAQRRLDDDPGFVPPEWTVYRLVPDAVEFWQGQPKTPQLRVAYRRQDGVWRRLRLWP